MTWPTDDLTKVHLDAGTDSPANARAELESLVDKVKLILAEATAGDVIWATTTAGSAPGSFDFKIGFNDQVTRGNSGNSRALVKETGTKLVINYAADFSGGVEVQSAIKVTGTTESTGVATLTAGAKIGGASVTTLSKVENASEIYTGSVSSTGTSIELPSGWSCSKSGTGYYNVDHSLGTSAYTMIISPVDSSSTVPFTAHLAARGTNGTEIRTWSWGSSSPFDYVASDCAFDFILIKQ